jgi:BolA protein
LEARQVETLLREKFTPLHLEVTNESAFHAGHSAAAVGGETHFSVIVVSSFFEGLSSLERHRAVFGVLLDGESTVHALKIRAYTEEEWKKIK